MNTTIVWVLMTLVSGGTSVPTLEFTSEKKCLAAAERIDKAKVEHSWRSPLGRSWCVWIEK